MEANEELYGEKLCQPCSLRGGGYNIILSPDNQNTLKGLPFEVLIFNALIELLFSRVNTDDIKSPSFKQGYITSFCNSFGVSSDVNYLSLLVIWILWQIFYAVSPTKRSFKSNVNDKRV